ncbi:hypothetical protein Tco_0861106 [Tanacetum coccineum]|uniref:Uncharacterized protein n=1 Tax=Tanacetum coccineum TaxID=301880 RepID=A0ABQ5BMI5_9ASTR
MLDLGAKIGIDEEIIARQKKLDKGRSVMSANQGKGVRKKRMARPRGNGVFIRDNVDPSCGNDSHTNLETDHENEIIMSDKSDSEQSLKSFYYLSEGEYEVIQLRKRMPELKIGGDEAEREV